MDSLAWLLVIAVEEAEHGRAVGVMELRHVTKYSRSTIHRELKKLIMRKIVVRVARGQYRLNGDNRFLRSVGLAVLMPMDVYEYHSVLAIQNREEKSA